MLLLSNKRRSELEGGHHAIARPARAGNSSALWPVRVSDRGRPAARAAVRNWATVKASSSGQQGGSHGHGCGSGSDVACWWGCWSSLAADCGAGSGACCCGCQLVRLNSKATSIRVRRASATTVTASKPSSTGWAGVDYVVIVPGRGLPPPGLRFQASGGDDRRIDSSFRLSRFEGGGVSPIPGLPSVPAGWPRPVLQQRLAQLQA